MKEYINKFINMGYAEGIFPINNITISNEDEDDIQEVIDHLKKDLNYQPKSQNDISYSTFFTSVRLAFTLGIGVGYKKTKDASIEMKELYDSFVSKHGFGYMNEYIEDLVGINYGSWLSKLIQSHLTECLMVTKELDTNSIESYYSDCIALFFYYGYFIQSYISEQRKTYTENTSFTSISQDGHSVFFVNRKIKKNYFSDSVRCFCVKSLAGTNCSINIPSELRIIDDYALQSTKFEKFTFPNNLKRIGVGAFFNCPYLKTVYLPEGLKSIGPKAFHGCKSLQEIEIPSTVVSIGGGAFSACDRLGKLKIASGNVNYVEHEGFIYNKNKDVLISLWKHATKIEIPLGTRHISSNAFFRCSSDSITIPEGVETIDDFSFGWCPNLREIKIPSSVVKISDTAFVGCPRLAKIVVERENNYYSDKCGILHNKDQTNIICVPLKADFEIDKLLSGVKRLGAGAFYSHKRIMGNINFPITLKHVGHDCFCHCDNITGIEFNSSDIHLHKYCFQNCKELRSVTIKATNISLGKSCFSNDPKFMVVIVSPICIYLRTQRK